MEEAEALADWVAIMDRGRLIAEGTVLDLIGRFGRETFVEFELPSSVLPELCARFLGKVTQDGERVLIKIEDLARDLSAFLSWAAQRGNRTAEPPCAPAQPGGRLPRPHRKEAARLTKVWTLALVLIRVSLRERESLFWFWIFLLALLAFLGAVFGRVEQGKMDLVVAVVDLDETALSAAVNKLAEQGSVRVVGKPKGTTEDLSGWAEREARDSRIHVALVIPAGFADQVLLGLAQAQPAAVPILYRRGEAGASLAASLLSEAVEEFSRSVLLRAGSIRATVPQSMHHVGSEPRTVSYVEFIILGVILMALFVAGIFNVPNAIVLAKETGILRRYFTTPLFGVHYLCGFSLSAVLISAFQILSIWALGRFLFQARLPFLRLEVLAYLLLAFGTALGLGFLISALATTYHAALALSNMVNLPLQFLGGLYFPVAFVPAALRAVMGINPLTHLAEGLRSSLELGTPWISFLTVALPLVFVLIFGFIFGGTEGPVRVGLVVAGKEEALVCVLSKFSGLSLRRFSEKGSAFRSGGPAGRGFWARLGWL